MGRVMLRWLWRRDDGAVTVDWMVLTAALVGLGIGAAVLVAGGTAEFAGKLRDALSNATVALGFGPGAEGPEWNPDPDFVMSERRLPMNPDHPTLWANPFHAHALPDGFPDLGGQEFTITGDGNPRLLVAGADPRVISGPDNPQFNEANYAASGTAFGSGGFHRILIDTPPPNTTHRVQITAGGQTIEYSLANRPY